MYILINVGENAYGRVTTMDGSIAQQIVIGSGTVIEKAPLQIVEVT